MLEALEQARATSIASHELSRSNVALLRHLAREISFHDGDLSERLKTPLGALSQIGR